MKLLIVDEVLPFVPTLQKPTQAKILRQLDLLEQYGHHLGPPHVKQLRKDLYELRVRGKQEVRLLFTFRESICYVLHAFVKKTQRTPVREISTALGRMP